MPVTIKDNPLVLEEQFSFAYETIDNKLLVIVFVQKDDVGIAFTRSTEFGKHPREVYRQIQSDEALAKVFASECWTTSDFDNAIERMNTPY